MSDMNGVSESRTYVAMCDKLGFSGFYFRKFVLPEGYENTAPSASWYFLNRLDMFSCSRGCIAWEDFQNVKDAE